MKDKTSAISKKTHIGLFKNTIIKYDTKSMTFILNKKLSFVSFVKQY